MCTTDRERGAAAVEFALVLPLLIVLVMGIIDFGRVYSAQQTLTNAAREGARAMALGQSDAAARTAARNASLALGALPDSAFAASPTPCTAGAQVTYTASYTLKGTGMFGSFPLTGRGVMLCGG